MSNPFRVLYLQVQPSNIPWESFARQIASHFASLSRRIALCIVILLKRISGEENRQQDPTVWCWITEEQVQAASWLFELLLTAIITPAHLHWWQLLRKGCWFSPENQTGRKKPKPQNSPHAAGMHIPSIFQPFFGILLRDTQYFLNHLVTHVLPFVQDLKNSRS